MDKTEFQKLQLEEKKIPAKKELEKVQTVRQKLADSVYDRSDEKLFDHLKSL